MKILVLIPAKDEAVKIKEVIAEVKAFGYEVLVVDDGSRDATAALSAEAGAKVLCHTVNRGQGAAIKTGITYALEHDFEAVVFFDADGQMAASEISRLVAPIEKGECVVALGSRFLGRTLGMPIAKKITLKMALLFTRLTTGLKLTDVHNGFQAWSRQALQKINLIQDRQAYASEILAEIKRLDLPYQEIPVTISYSQYSRAKGQSILNAFNILWDLLIKR